MLSARERLRLHVNRNLAMQQQEAKMGGASDKGPASAGGPSAPPRGASPGRLAGVSRLPVPGPAADALRRLRTSRLFRPNVMIDDGCVQQTRIRRPLPQLSKAQNTQQTSASRCEPVTLRVKTRRATATLSVCAHPRRRTPAWTACTAQSQTLGWAGATFLVSLASFPSAPAPVTLLRAATRVAHAYLPVSCVCAPVGACGASREQKGWVPQSLREIRARRWQRERPPRSKCSMSPWT